MPLVVTSVLPVGASRQVARVNVLNACQERINLKPVALGVNFARRFSSAVIHAPVRRPATSVATAYIWATMPPRPTEKIASTARHTLTALQARRWRR